MKNILFACQKEEMDLNIFDQYYKSLDWVGFYPFQKSKGES